MPRRASGPRRVRSRRKWLGAGPAAPVARKPEFVRVPAPWVWRRGGGWGTARAAFPAPPDKGSGFLVTFAQEREEERRGARGPSPLPGARIPGLPGLRGCTEEPAGAVHGAGRRAELPSCARPRPAVLGLPAARAAPLRTPTCHPRPPRARPNPPSALCERVGLRARSLLDDTRVPALCARPRPAFPLLLEGGGLSLALPSERQTAGGGVCSGGEPGVAAPGEPDGAPRLRGHSLSCSSSFRRHVGGAARRR